MNTMIALLKREAWEHRSIWMVPSAMAALSFVMFLWVTLYVIPHNANMDNMVADFARFDRAQLSGVHGVLLSSLLVSLAMVSTFVMFFYLLDSLYAERRDRSILFWKSLPVTDTATVFSKWLTALVVIPFVTAAIAVILHFIFTVLGGFIVAAWGANPWAIVWSTYNPFGALWNGVVVYLVNMLWYLPLFGWLLLCSAWAKKAPFLWAVLPPVAIGIIERIFFGSRELLGAIGSRLAPYPVHNDAFVKSVESDIEAFGGHVRLGGLPHLDAEIFLDMFSSAGFWGGLVFAAACTAGAIWLRRYRDES